MRAVALRRHYRYWRRFRGSVGVLALLVLFVGATAFSVSLHQPSETVTLPVEIIGPNGTTKAITVEASDVSNVHELYLRAHSIGYPDHVIEEQGYQVDKASIRINGGPWIDVNNRVAACEEPEASIGCITGPYHTIRLAIPIAQFGGVRPGSNTIEFRFNYASPDVSTGYRVLDVELRTTSGRDAIDGTTFVWDDPAEWTAPQGYDTSGDIDAGKKLWHERDFLVDGWDGPPIKAACSDCHARNGRDLQYFAFSNESIVERSEFHGLSEEEGKQIAAYIRSIELRTKDGQSYAPPGRPWEPPYQPGPTALATRSEDDPRTAGQPFEEAGQHTWAAGAGLDWVFDSDSETYPYLFPGGMSFDDVAVDELAQEAGAQERRLNMRTLPLALQMPDWNEWLPKFHPMDAYGEEFTSQTTGGHPHCQDASAAAWDYYNSEVQPLDESSGYGHVENTLNIFGSKVNSFRKCKKHSSVSGYHDGDAKISIHAWGAVKEWEVLHTYGYEDMSGKLYSGGEALGWGGHQRVIFNMAPHIVGTGADEEESPKGPPSGTSDKYYDTAWYQHQLTLNSGHGFFTGTHPVDWKYHFQHVLGYRSRGGPQDVRHMASYLKLLQNAEMASSDYSDTEPEGWYMKHVTPAWIVRPGKRYLSGMNQVVENGECHANSLMAKFLIDGITGEDKSEWARQTGAKGIEPSDYSPRLREQQLTQNDPGADQLLTAMWLYSERGVPAEILRPLAEWGEAMWPGSDWHQHIDENAECGSLGNIADDNPTDDDPGDDDQTWKD